MILNAKATLSDDEQEWNQKFGEVLKNKNSEFYKCFFKKFDWADEYPGNNYNYHGPWGKELGCPLSDQVDILAGSKFLQDTLFRTGVK